LPGQEERTGALQKKHEKGGKRLEGGRDAEKKVDPGPPMGKKEMAQLTKKGRKKLTTKNAGIGEAEKKGQ